MSEKTKVVLLGSNANVLRPVVEKINKTRPVEVMFFTNLKNFIEYSLANPKDIIGFGVAYPHKNAKKFPKIFKMVLNSPVIAFGEADGPKTHKMLASVNADYKINGTINAHNLWMRIQNFLRDKEAAENPESQDPESKNASGSSDVLYSGGSKNTPDTGSKLDSSNLMKSLFDAIENGDEDFTPSNISYLGGGGDSEGNKSKSMNHITGDAGNKQSLGGSAANENMSVASSKSGDGVKTASNKLNKKSESELANALGSLLEEDADESKKNANGNKNDLASLKGSKGEYNINNPNSIDQDLSSSNKKENQKLNNQKAETVSNGRDKPLQPPKLSDRKDSASKDSDSQEAGPIVAALTKDADSEEKRPALNNKSNENKDQNRQDDDDFGKVQLSDEKEVQKEAIKKEKDKKKKSSEKLQDLLKVSCEEGIQSVYKTGKDKVGLAFETSINHCFIVELDQYLGFLLLSTNEGIFFDEDRVKKFRVELIENLKERGIKGTISEPITVNANLNDYKDRAHEFTEFQGSFNSEGGDQQFICFVKREVVKPTIEESDMKDMKLVSLKFIPPQTPVNFDAFIYLPRNKKFVRYLREGRSLSLKQAKRHTELANGDAKFFIPNGQEKNFIKFYIQNTLNWEIELNKQRKNNVA